MAEVERIVGIEENIYMHLQFLRLERWEASRTGIKKEEANMWSPNLRLNGVKARYRVATLAKRKRTPPPSAR